MLARTDGFAPSYVVKKRAVVTGEMLTRRPPGFDQQTGQPVVEFRFNGIGARRFGDVTRQNVGKRFAIVLDKKVISAPRDPGRDHRRLGPDHRQLHAERAPTTWRCCCGPARCRRR